MPFILLLTLYLYMENKQEKKQFGRPKGISKVKRNYNISPEAAAIVELQGFGQQGKYVEDAIFFYTLYKDKIKQEL